MKYIKLFQTTSDYNNFVESEDYILPNVTYCKDNPTMVFFNPYDEGLSHDYSQDYFTLIALEDNTEFSFNLAENWPINISTDNGETWTSKYYGDSVIVNQGDKVLCKGNLESNTSYGLSSSVEITKTGSGSGSGSGSSSYTDYISFHIYSNKSYNIEGNIMSLLYGDDFSGQTSISSSNFVSLFSGDTHLYNASNLILPATTLAPYCYNNMFNDCTSLVTAPELPATTLAEYCYNEMFKGCIALTTAPELPATTLAEYCYNEMFIGCTSLTTAPELPATTLSQGCYNYMFKGCTSLTTAPSTLPATTLADDCYKGMFNGCTSLTTAPTLPATTLVFNCYGYMFYGCSNLNYIKAMFTTTPGTYTTNWVDGVASTGTFVKNSAATWNVNGKNGVPSGWTIETAAA